MTALFPYQARAWWRGVAAGDTLGGLNLLVLGAAFVKLAPPWIEMCRRAVEVERATAGILVAWILLPLLVREMHVSHGGVSVSKLLRLPFSRAQLLAAAVLGSFAHPAVAVLFAITWFVMVPLGVGTGVVFVIACVALSWSVLLMMTAMFRTRAGLLIAALVVSGVVAAGRAWLPPALAARAAQGDGAAFAGLVAWGGAALVAAPFLLGWLLGRPAASGGRRSRTRTLGGLPGVPGPVGVAAAKELRYLGRTADAFVAAVIGVLGAAYVAVAGEPTPAVLAVVSLLVVVTQAGAPLNAFGLDRSGIDRYRLLPLSGSEMLASKNVAFGALLLLQLAPLLVVAAWRFGPLAAAALLFGILSYAFAAVLIGNFASTRAAAPREFHGVESIEQSGGIIPAVALLAAWIPPAALAGAAAVNGNVAIAGGELLLAGLLAVIYVRTLRRVGSSLEARFDDLRERVAG